jgi:hypothetical protein
MRCRISGNPDVESEAIRSRLRFAGPRVCLDATLGILILFFTFNIIPVTLDGGNVIGLLSADEAGNLPQYPKPFIMSVDEEHGPAHAERLLAARPSHSAQPGEAGPLVVRRLPSRRALGDSPPDPF